MQQNATMPTTMGDDLAALDLTAAPFNLDAEAQAWVHATRASLTPRDKLAQLFILLSRDAPEAALESLRAFKPAGITRIYSPDLPAELNLINAAHHAGPVPMLVSADLEGSRMSLPFGTEVPNPLGLAAIDDVETTTAIATIMAEEAQAVGLNWSFTPVIDLNIAFQSAIVGTRSYGSDRDRVERHALAQIAAFQANGVAATVKHWPGEGFDDRDQHLVTTVNPLSLEDWEANFGRLYRSAIDAGVMSVMSAHIAFPAYVLAKNPNAGAEAYRPAVISELLNKKLLREELGFNGLIVTDATPMAGFNDWGPRAEIIPEAIIAGCDLILFSDDHNADLMSLVKAVADGRLSQTRVDEAVTRVLALKAALGLHKSGQSRLDLDAARSVLDRIESKQTARSAHQKVPTLVKDIQKLLPLTPAKHKRVLVFSSGVFAPFAPVALPLTLPDLLREAGFEITEYTPDMQVNAKNYDLVLYLLAEETLLTKQRIFLNWRELTGNVFGAMKRYWHEVPTLMVSFGYPYYLYDAPRVPTYVNAYGSNEDMQQAVLDCLLGKEPFLGNSPVDPFCGSDQAKY